MVYIHHRVQDLQRFFKIFMWETNSGEWISMKFSDKFWINMKTKKDLNYFRFYEKLKLSSPELISFIQLFTYNHVHEIYKVSIILTSNLLYEDFYKWATMKIRRFETRLSVFKITSAVKFKYTYI